MAERGANPCKQGQPSPFLGERCSPTRCMAAAVASKASIQERLPRLVARAQQCGHVSSARDLPQRGGRCRVQVHSFQRVSPRRRRATAGGQIRPATPARGRSAARGNLARGCRWPGRRGSRARASSYVRPRRVQRTTQPSVIAGQPWRAKIFRAAQPMAARAPPRLRRTRNGPAERHNSSRAPAHRAPPTPAPRGVRCRRKRRARVAHLADADRPDMPNGLLPELDSGHPAALAPDRQLQSATKGDLSSRRVS